MRFPLCLSFFLLNIMYVCAQTHVLYDSLLPFQINRIDLNNPYGLPPGTVSVRGKTYSDRNILLYSGKINGYTKEHTCYFYLDTEIHTISILWGGDKGEFVIKVPPARNSDKLFRERGFEGNFTPYTRDAGTLIFKNNNYDDVVFTLLKLSGRVLPWRSKISLLVFFAASAAALFLLKSRSYRVGLILSLVAVFFFYNYLSEEHDNMVIVGLPREEPEKSGTLTFSDNISYSVYDGRAYRIQSFRERSVERGEMLLFLRAYSYSGKYPLNLLEELSLIKFNDPTLIIKENGNYYVKERNALKLWGIDEVKK